jgi:hypothetical protein
MARCCKCKRKSGAKRKSSQCKGAFTLPIASADGYKLKSSAKNLMKKLKKKNPESRARVVKYCRAGKVSWGVNLYD